MKTKNVASGLALAGLIAIGLVVQSTKNASEVSFRLPKGEKSTPMGVLVKFKEGIISPLKVQHATDELNSASLQAIFTKYGVSSMACVFKNRYDAKGLLKQNLAKDNGHLLENWQLVLLPSLAEAKQFMDNLKKESDVVHIQLDEPFEFKPAATPNDQYYTSNFQWHLNDTSFPTADIDAPEAWDINKGRNDVIIAILDGGVDYNHLDMDPGDRSHVIAGIDTGDGDNDPLDDLPYGNPDSYAGHGTSVAGIVGAITNNSRQVSGVMWNCKIMPVKMVGGGNIKFPFIGTVVDFVATAFPGDVANAIDYAVNNGAHVINLSYGFHSAGFLLDQVVLSIPLLYQTLDNAYLNNVVTCAAMGNEYETDNSPSYPAGFYEQVIPVGATTRTRSRASFSNTGAHISVSAPGAGIYTTERGR
jgi:subtilisin family serine protease